ncbi:hypothetical protein ES703_26104 [subsurface metagenome]
MEGRDEVRASSKKKGVTPIVLDDRERPIDIKINKGVRTVKRRILSFIFALLLVLSFSLVTAVPVAAAEIPVSSEMTTGEINAAIAAAEDGDVVQFAAGTYILTERLEVYAERQAGSVTLRGDPATPGDVVLNAGADATRVIHIDTEFAAREGTTITIEGFDITGDSAEDTGITVAAFDTSTSVTNVVIKNNHFHDINWGINAWGYLAYSDGRDNRVNSIEIVNNKFYDLKAAPGEGQVGAGVVLETLGDRTLTGGAFAATVKNNTFENIADLGELHGAGVFIQWKVFLGAETELGDSAANAQVVNNEFSGVSIGVAVGGTVTNTQLSYNNFNCSVYGVMANNISEGPLDATNNWWGHVDGPSHGSVVAGDNVSENVVYWPWLPAEQGTISSGADLTAIYSVSAVVIGIVLDTASVDFGAVEPGVAKASTPLAVTVSNIGDVAVNLDATIEGELPSLIYSAPDPNGLTIAGTHVSTWTGSAAVNDDSGTLPLILTVPAGTAPGTYTATLVFWAEASP